MDDKIKLPICGYCLISVIINQKLENCQESKVLCIEKLVVCKVVKHPKITGNLVDI